MLLFKVKSRVIRGIEGTIDGSYAWRWVKYGYQIRISDVGMRIRITDVSDINNSRPTLKIG